MAETKVWTIEVAIEETPDVTEARTSLTIGGVTFNGWGRARRNPADPDIPKIGEELATARSLNDLSHKLIEAAAQAIESFEGHKVRVHS